MNNDLAWLYYQNKKYAAVYNYKKIKNEECLHYEDFTIHYNVGLNARFYVERV